VIAPSADLSRLVDAARAAIDRTGRASTSFRLAGRTVRLVGAGPALLDRVRPAFAHLPSASDGEPADLTVLLWDTASTGEPLPTLGEAAPQVGTPVTPILHDGGRSFVFHAFEGAVSYLDHEGGIGVYAVEDATRLPPWERACPLRALLTWWTSPQRLLLAHGAAVGSSDGAVLLAGPGGSGKSTTALACFADGWGYLGDDYVLLDVDDACVWSAYGSAKLAPDHLDRFPGLLAAEPPGAHDPLDAKRVGWPVRDRPEATVVAAPVRAIVMPTVTGGPTSALRPLPASRALMALAPLTMFQTPGDQNAAFRLSTAIARQAPSFALDLGDDVERVPGLLESLLAGAEGGS
jgi:hypothetical protein